MKLLVDLPDNMIGMCKWHRNGIGELVKPEIDILADAIAEGKTLAAVKDELIQKLTNLNDLVKDEYGASIRYSDCVMVINEYFKGVENEDTAKTTDR